MMKTALIRAILEGLHFSGLSALARHRAGGIGAILMLHHVRDERRQSFNPNSFLSVTPGFLDDLISALKQSGYEFVSMDEAARRIRAGTAVGSAPFLSVTLDDGYRDNLEHAVPVLRAHGVPFIIYVPTGFVEGSATIWWEDLEEIIRKRDQIVMHMPKGRVSFDLSTPGRKHKAYWDLIRFLGTVVSEKEQREIIRELAWQAGIDTAAHCRAQIMNWGEISRISGDMLGAIGAHTMHHYAIARIPEAEALTEMTEGSRIIEMETGKWPRHFAFPYGFPFAAGPRDFLLASQCGFDTAVTTRHGVIYPEHAGHMHALPRVSLNGLFQQRRYVTTLLSGLPTLIGNRGRRLNVG
jgi:peptidoglycan/xylan/chitin deacetylase (PgdA/CDA1 family)